MRIDAPAKINLYLGVRPGVDAGGYHGATTVMCPLELADEVEVVPNNGGLALSCSPNPLPSTEDAMRGNIAYRAAVLLGEALGKEPAVSISIRKHVPSQAGLGGGSSDAAAVLRCLCAMWGVDAGEERVVAVARKLGADVPFFLQDLPALMVGRGDVLSERFPPFRAPLVLAKPSSGVSTPAAYRAFDARATPLPPIEDLLDALRRQDMAGVAGNLANNFEPSVLDELPELREVFSWLGADGSRLGDPVLCGSGSSVACFVKDAAAAERLAAEGRRRGLWACATATRSVGCGCGEGLKTR